MTKSLKVYLSTVIAWLVVCVGYNIWWLATYTPNPNDGDLYAHNWGYQLIVLIVFRFPVWVIALLVLLCVEMIVFRKRETTSERLG